MQNSLSENMLIEAPRVIPTPVENTRRKKRLSAQILLSGFCATFAICVLALCGMQKINGIAEKGFLATLAETLLKEVSPVSESVFGSPILADKQLLSQSSGYFTLPRIYYIPKESIIDDSILKAKELEKKMFELYSFDYGKVPKGAYPIIPVDVSAASLTSLKNDTSYSIDMESVVSGVQSKDKTVIGEEPLVLIVHTHGTEGFSENKYPYYNDETNVPRSEDVSKNIVAVGKVLAEALNKKGIPTLHCETMHDKDSYISAYDRSAESIKHYLEKYPSIKYVFDVHRDSLIQSDLTKLRPVTIHNGEACAQIMMIVGTGEKGGIEYDWEANLSLAAAVQEKLFEDTLSVARQIYLRGATYNQQYARYGLLLEIGSCGNSLAEAKNAAIAFANAFEKAIK